MSLHDIEIPTYEQIRDGVLKLIDEGKISREDAAHVLPELRESKDEDERIRKALIQFLTDIKSISESGRTSWAVRREDAEMCNGFLAYLEKQKEQKPVPKFSVGDYVKDTKYRGEPLYQIVGIDKECYICEYRGDNEMGDRAVMHFTFDNPYLRIEQKPLMSDGEIEDKKRDIVAAIRKYYPADYAAYLTSFLKGLSPEDNSEDEYGQEMLGIAYKLMYEHIPENLRTQEFWDSLKFMREYTGKVAIIHSYEHPAEWSEEDEKKIGRLRSIVNDCAFRNDALDVNGDYCEGDYAELDDWLKSLRPCGSSEKPNNQAEWSKEDEIMFCNLLSFLEGRVGLLPKGQKKYSDWMKTRFKYAFPLPHWKPSEEQMDAILWEIQNTSEGSWQRREMESLYNDLKKL